VAALGSVGTAEANMASSTLPITRSRAAQTRGLQRPDCDQDFARVKLRSVSGTIDGAL